ncbi:MAG: family 20 glycosylhydrolase [Verrucomicrobia bacterium]|nr:family 20 glycosylhydrolase [Verrucomicrobiota bacterium]
MNPSIRIFCAIAAATVTLNGLAAEAPPATPARQAAAKDSQSASPVPLNLIPWPKSVEVQPGAINLGPQSRVVAGDVSLRPLAEVLAEEVFLATGLRLATATGRPAVGDVLLRLDPQLKGEAYALEAGETMEVRGGNYGAVALGTVTLLQALGLTESGVSCPRLSVSDSPGMEYRGLLVDLARRYHSIENLKQMARLCRLYKIRYLQLHLTDDQAFMFPSRAYPQLTTKNQHGGKAYTLEELKDLVAYADARNVTIIPEYEVPGHSAAANRAMPDLFLIKGTKPYVHHASINFAKDEVMQAVATVVGEMCEVFKSSPYFHIGGDEADLAFAHQNEDFKAAFKKYNLSNQHQLYRRFVTDMDEIVKRNGKKMIVWEGFGREPGSPVRIPKDIIVMAYEIRFYLPDQLVKDGYQVINASWTPLYVVNRGRPPAEIYAWHLRQFKPYGASPSDLGVIVPPDAAVFGAQLCAWEQPESAELANERLRLAAMSERVWNPTAGKDCADFTRRLVATDRLLDRLVHGFTIQVEGLLDSGEYRFDQSLALTLTLSPPRQGSIRYTLDGKEPGTNSPIYADPIRLATTTDFRARAFDERDQPVGYPQSIRYEFHPIRGEARDLLPDGKFADALTLTLKSTAPGDIRYTLDGKDPKTNALLYAGPFKVQQSVKLKAALFVGGKRQGEMWAENYTRANAEKKPNIP